MICEKCKEKMNWSIEGATQGWRCPVCGWNIITTYIDEINSDETEYSLYIKKVSEIDAETIKFVAKTANDEYICIYDE
ncbi:MAG: cytidine deaminase [Lachnospiraceae bacterium]